MTDLSSLIARLEKEEGPSTELDAHVRLALLVKNDAAYVMQSPFNGAWLIYAGEHNGRPRLYENRDRSIPTELWRGEYTRSIDAAVSLAERVLPGCGHGYDKAPNGRCVASLNQSDDQWTYEGWPSAHGATPALALVLATLRALPQKGSSNG